MLTRTSLLALAFAFASTSFAQTALAPLDGSERAKWLLRENLGPGALLENVAIGALSTLSNSPTEYGPHWEGFGKRVGLVTANYGVQSVMEVGLGSIWGEDPRYDRTTGQPFKSRLGHAIKMTFLANYKSGGTKLAYGRLIAVPATSFAANSWLPDSQSTAGDAAARAGLSMLSRMAENLFKEFRPHH